MSFPVASPIVIENARQIRALNPVYLDTETTGFARDDVVVQIGIVDANGEVILDTLVNPNKPIPPASIAVHGISDEMVADAPQWKEIWPDVVQILNRSIVGMYNAEFDLRLMRQTHEMNGGGTWTVDKNRFFCAMLEYAAFYGDIIPRSSGFRKIDFYGDDIERVNDYRLHKLEQAGAQCGILLPNSHRAVDDARLTAALMDYIAQYTPDN